MGKVQKTYMQFRVDTVSLLTEIADAGLDRGMGVLKIPINIFKDLLADVAQRATELNDPRLNILMLRLALYEVPNNKIPEMIEHMEKLVAEEEECKKSERNESIEFASWLLQQDITSRGEGKYVNDRGEIVTVSDLYKKFKNR